jgi:phosphate transport system protein
MIRFLGAAMSVHLQRQLQALRNRVLSLHLSVEEQLGRAVGSLVEGSAAMAGEVERRAVEIHQRRLQLEEECLKTLALYRPCGDDLRLVAALLKSVSELEWIGDLAVNLAREAAVLGPGPDREASVPITAMWTRARTMLRDGVAALVNVDPDLARAVCDCSPESSATASEVQCRMEATVPRRPDRSSGILRLSAAACMLARVVDCAVTVAKDAIRLNERSAHQAVPG